MNEMVLRGKTCIMNQLVQPILVHTGLRIVMSETKNIIVVINY